MSLSTRENTIHARETMLLCRETSLAEREARVIDRETRLQGKEKWAADLLEREKLIHEREKIVHEREQRLERLVREQDMKMDIDTFTSPVRRPLQESRSGNASHYPRSRLTDSGNRSDRFSGTYPPPQYTEYTTSTGSANMTAPLPTIPKSPSRLQSTTSALTPRRRRTTLGLGSPTRELNPSLSPVKSHANLRATNQTLTVNMNNLRSAENAERQEGVVGLVRRNTSTMASRLEKAGGMVKVAARNTFRGRENEIVDWERECEANPQAEMPSPFLVRRKGASSRISGGISRPLPPIR